MKFVDKDGYVYAEVTGAMYGLAQSGWIANRDLQKHLAKYSYASTKRTLELWKHCTQLISFKLVVDDFGMKYTNKDDIDDLFKAIKHTYPLKINWDGTKYIGIDLKWNYIKREVTLPMKGYVKQSLKKVQHQKPTKHHYGPTKYKPPEYGKKIQYITVDISPELTDKSKNLIQ